jgi:di/tricarboxylate transporter
MVVPLELLLLAVVLLAVVLGWLSPQEALAGFSNPATLTVVAMFAVSAAVVRTGAVAPLQSFLERHGGQSPSRQLLLLGLVVGPLSALLNNTAVVAVFIPVVEQWCRRLGVPPARMLMPLSFMTVMAGVATLLGTSTNLVASSLADQLGYGSFQLFQFTPMALVTYGCGLTLLVLLAPWLLPGRPGETPISNRENDYGIHDYLSELAISERSPLVGQRLDDTLLQHTFDTRILALIRDGERFSLPLGGRTLHSGDQLLVRAPRHQLLALRDQEGLDLLPEMAAEPDQEQPLDTSVEVLVPSGSRLIGQSLREIRFSQRYNSTVLAIRRGQTLLRDRLGQVALRLGDALLLQTPRGSVAGLQVSRDLLVVDATAHLETRRDRLPWALGLATMMLLLDLVRPDLVVVWSLLAVVGLVAARVLTAQELYGAVRWDVVVLLAVLLPLARLLGQSGAIDWLTTQLGERLAQWPAFGLLAGLYVMTALITELVSNQGAVTLMLPLGLGLSGGLGLNPLAVMGVITFAASSSFLSPVGYQTNTMVYAVGGYRFRDFLKLGLPLSVMLAGLTPLLALHLWP